jgi:drug/metabolite transporter (DMT)-like permease
LTSRAGAAEKTAMTIDRKRLALLLLAVPPLLWSTNTIMGKALSATLPPVGWAFWRWAVATMVLLPVAGPALWTHRQTVLRHWKLMVAYGVAGVAIYNAFVYVALHTTTATNAAVLNSAVPVFIPIIAFFVTRERIRAPQAAGIAVSLAGVIWIVARGDLGNLAALRFTTGDLWVIAANLDWALYSVILRWRPKDLPPLPLLLCTTLVGMLALLPFYVVEHLSGAPVPFTPLALIVILYIGIGPSVLSYIAWNGNVARFGATVTGLSLHLMPVFTPLLATLLLDERIHLYHAVGIALVLGGIAIATAAPRR